ncbi:hypothetical protein [Paraferrimonas sedimenticola]|nr:hypothetical protein [Paraferrimonas sedimenticola]
MRTAIALILFGLLSNTVHAQVFKCVHEDKIVFSQTSCPKEYRESEVSYSHGFTFEISNDPVKGDKLITLVELLQSQDLPQEQMLEQIATEISRIQQENDYLELLKESELKTLERRRYWQKQGQSDAAFAKSQLKVRQHYNNLVSDNLLYIVRLETYRDELIQTPEEIENP